MTIPELSDLVHASTEELIRADILHRDNCGKGVICPHPNCKSGSHREFKGDGPTESKTHPGYFFCHRCKKCFDAIDYVQADRNVTPKDAIQIVADALGQSIEWDHTKSPDKPHSFTGNTPTAAPTAAPKPKPDPEPETDYTEFIAECAARIEDTDYHRGISLDTLKRFSVGYCPEWVSPTGIRTAKARGKRNPPPSPRLIIPTSKHSYIARDTRPDADVPERSKLFIKQKEGNVHIFNTDALHGADPVYIVEGEIDALSIIDAGVQAVGLGSTSEADQLLSILEGMESKPVLILALDQDDAGRKCTAKLQCELLRLGVPFYAAKQAALYGDCKDANEALNANPIAFIANIRNAAQLAAQYAEHPTAAEAKETKEQARQEARSDAEREAIAAFCDAYKPTFEEHTKPGYTRFTPTGFVNLDFVLGGLCPGLYVLGAGTGTGKTSLALQMSCNVAASDHPVVYVALEMSRDELIGKSISRLSYEIGADQGDNEGTDTLSILRGICGPHAEEAQARFFDTIAPNLCIMEGIGDIGTPQIERMVRTVADMRGRAPFVVVDYAQLLESPDVHYSEYTAMNRNTYALKRLSRDMNIPLLAISSLNRASYDINRDTPTHQLLAALKESGALEFTSTATLIMYRLDDFDPMDPLPKSMPRTRQIEMRICKGRWWGAVPRLQFNFDGIAGSYKPINIESLKEDEEPERHWNA